MKTHSLLAIVLLLVASASAQPTSGSRADGRQPVWLRELAWPDVANYLATSDMILIPVGSTEQHGLHLPLGTDAYEAEGLAAEISRRTGVMVAPTLPVGISPYHSGFPGTITLSEETMGQVLLETVASLRQHGFRRFLLLNGHGGNKIVLENVIHHVNHHTDGTAVLLGIGSTVTRSVPLDPFDWHAGVQETSEMLYLYPDKVRMERARKPVISFSAEMQKLQRAAAEHPVLDAVYQAQFTTDASLKKGGSSRELSDTGVWSLDDPAKASRGLGERVVGTIVDSAVEFIQAWQQTK